MRYFLIAFIVFALAVFGELCAYRIGYNKGENAHDLPTLALYAYSKGYHDALDSVSLCPLCVCDKIDIKEESK
jgi:hypothetical protein